jgi:predicted ester cyclase
MTTSPKRLRGAAAVAAFAACAACAAFAASAHAQGSAALTLDEARRIVAPFYDALNRPATKNVDELFASVTTSDWQSCGGNDVCVPRQVVVGAVKRRGADVPDLAWAIVDVRVAGADTIVVRGEATGTPAREFFGVAPTGKAFRVMSVDVHTVRDGRIARSYHVEDWAGAMRQVRARP